MKRRYYFDTSVFGGVFDDEFSKDSIQLFEQVNRGEVICLYSKMVLEELVGAPLHVRLFASSLPWNAIEKVHRTPEIEQLAIAYIGSSVVEKNSFDDCIHIAAATVSKADVLISWNFRHIVNSRKIDGYNSVNVEMGYSSIQIRSPKDLQNEIL